MNKSKVVAAFQSANTDKWSVHGYQHMYAEVLEDNFDSLLEIGVLTGRSLVAWRHLYPKATIWGIDITDKKFKPELLEYADPQNIIIHDSTDVAIQEKIDRTFDIIIDDGHHFYKNQIKTFNNFKDKFNKVYVIEDIHSHRAVIYRHLQETGLEFKEFSSEVRGKILDAGLIQTGRRHNNGETVIANIYAVAIFK